MFHVPVLLVCVWRETCLLSLCEKRLLNPARGTQYSHRPHSTDTLEMVVALTQVWTCFLIAWLFAGTHGKTPDVQVTCPFSEACILPCLFQPVGGEEVQWFKQDVLVYSHPQSVKQTGEHPASRMSMSAQQLSAGNASLLLQYCGSQDRGRYKCRINRGEQENDSFVIVKIVAPIRSVNLKTSALSGYKEVKCSTHDIYPAPRVWWSTEPATSTDELQPVTRIMAPKWKNGLFSMESKVRWLGNRPGLTYTCTINMSYSSQTWKTSLSEKVLSNGTLTSKSSFTWSEVSAGQGKNLTIPCSVPPDMENFTLTWSFTRKDKHVVIDMRDSATRLTFGEGVGGSGPQAADRSLQLVNPQALKHTGTYTCTASSLHRTHVAQTQLNIISPAGQREMVMDSATQWWIPAIVITILTIIAAVIVGILKCKDKWSRTSITSKTTDARQLRVMAADTDVICGGSHHQRTELMGKLEEELEDP